MYKPNANPCGHRDIIDQNLLAKERLVQLDIDERINNTLLIKMFYTHFVSLFTGSNNKNRFTKFDNNNTDIVEHLEA